MRFNLVKLMGRGNRERNVSKVQMKISKEMYIKGVFSAETAKIHLIAPQFLSRNLLGCPQVVSL